MSYYQQQITIHTVFSAHTGRSRGSHPTSSGFQAAVHSHTQGPRFQELCSHTLPCNLCPAVAAAAPLDVVWITRPVVGAGGVLETTGRFSSPLVPQAYRFLQISAHTLPLSGMMCFCNYFSIPTLRCLVSPNTYIQTHTHTKELFRQ